jgi:hypothetical protein
LLSCRFVFLSAMWDEVCEYFLFFFFLCVFVAMCNKCACVVFVYKLCVFVPICCSYVCKCIYGCATVDMFMCECNGMYKCNLSVYVLVAFSSCENRDRTLMMLQLVIL